MIQAEAGGRTISEMHVDGGTTAQILTLPDDAPDRRHCGAGCPAAAYLHDREQQAQRRVPSRHAPDHSDRDPVLQPHLRSSLAETVNLNYLYAKAHGIDFSLSFIPRAYPKGDTKLFDTDYMRGLYDYGLKLGQSGDFWKKQPPDQGE